MARRMIELFEAVQRQELKAKGQATVVFTTELTQLQRQKACASWATNPERAPVDLTA